MGSAESGKWIFGGVIYYLLAFTLCFTISSIAIDNPLVDTSNIIIGTENSGLTDNCIGQVYDSCSEITLRHNITGADCYDYGNCYSIIGGEVSGFTAWFSFLGSLVVDVDTGGMCVSTLGDCSDYNNNQTQCENVGCLYGVNYGDYILKLKSLQADASVSTKSLSAMVSSLKLMFGFNGTVDGTGNFSIILLMLLNLLPMSMIIFGVYFAVRG